MSDRKPCPHLHRKAKIEANEIEGTHLGELGGLKRTGVSIARIPPGRDSLAEHMHHREEEWIHIRSRRQTPVRRSLNHSPV